MKKTVEAIKYGLETLNLTPKEMFSLIESSKGYEGSDYSRWLANEIIKIAEKDEVGYSQLLAKWFNIIQGIIEEHLDESICKEFDYRIRHMLKGWSYSYGIPTPNNYGSSTEEIDWGKGLDLPFNYEFIESLPEEIRGRIENNEELTFLMRLGGEGKITGSPLVPDAKSNGVILKSYDALLLYRMTTMYRALGEEANNLYFVVIVNTETLYNPENAELIKYLLSFIKCDGYAVDSKDLYETSYTNESYALLTCRALQSSDEIQDGIVLPKMLKNGDIVGTYRYSRGSDMWRALISEVGTVSDDVYAISERGYIVSKQAGNRDALGYLCNSTHLSNPLVSTCPIAGSEVVPIVAQNFHRCLAYYGVVTSLRGQRLSSDITDILSGHPDYMHLVGNCLPLLLFDANNHWGVLNGDIDGESVMADLPFFLAEFISEEVESLSVYFSYEAKELMELGKQVWIANNKAWGRTFGEMLCSSRENNPSLDKEYLNAVSRCQTYICSLYKSMQ